MTTCPSARKWAALALLLSLWLLPGSPAPAADDGDGRASAIMALNSLRDQLTEKRVYILKNVVWVQSSGDPYFEPVFPSLGGLVETLRQYLDICPPAPKTAAEDLYQAVEKLNASEIDYRASLEKTRNQLAQLLLAQISLSEIIWPLKLKFSESVFGEESAAVKEALAAMRALNELDRMIGTLHLESSLAPYAEKTGQYFLPEHWPPVETLQADLKRLPGLSELEKRHIEKNLPEIMAMIEQALKGLDDNLSGLKKAEAEMDAALENVLSRIDDLRNGYIAGGQTLS